MKKIILTIAMLCLMIHHSDSAVRRLRATYRTNPSTSISLGWDQYSGNSPVLYYGTTDHGTNSTLYPSHSSPVLTTSDGGMNNTFVRLTGLTPNTIYYFVIADSEGTSQRYSFQTISDNPNQPLSLIFGADTRAGIEPRIIGFKLVAKLRPQAVVFDGDLTDSGLDNELQDWFDDWSYTIAPDGRITPIVMAEGNHEFGIINISNLFDTPYIGSNSLLNYYSIPFGGSLLRVYNLNSFVDIPTETSWLFNELSTYGNTTAWNVPQYHLPVRPLVSTKTNDQDEYNQWVPLFEQYNVKLIQEADAHVFSMTWPVLKSTATGNDEGFIRDDVHGIVYFGQGGWGAPLYVPDSPKSWTRGVESMYHFMLIHFFNDHADIYTVRFENEPNVPVLTDQNRMTLPSQLSLETLTDRDGVQSGDHVSLLRITASVSENYNTSISIYPTVVQNYLTVKSNPPDQGTNVRIIDLTGRIINNVPMNAGGELQINMSGYEPGVYFVDLFNQKSLKVMKIIKQ